MWMLINLSKNYTTTISYTIEYINLPQTKILQEQPIKQIEVTVSGSGFKLLGASFSSKKIVFSLDKLIKKNKNDFYLLTSSHKEKIAKNMNSGLRLMAIEKDSIHFKLGTLAAKKVPVFVDANLTYKPGYGVEEIVLSQDSILISGPELQLSKISQLKTKNLKLQDVSEDLNVNLAIELPKDITGIKMNHDYVDVKILIDKFTEGSFEIPIKIIGVPNQLKLSTFPKKVKVIYKVGLKNYQKITQDLFEIVCDYNKTMQSQVTYLIPELKKRPELISSVRIVPQRIDFLIHK